MKVSKDMGHIRSDKTLRVKPESGQGLSDRFSYVSFKALLTDTFSERS